MCRLIRADTVTGTNPASEFLMGSQLSGAEPFKAKLPVLVSEPGWGCLAPVWRRQTSVSSHHCFHGGLFPGPPCARHGADIIPETESSPKTLQQVTQSLLAPAHVSRGDAPGSVPPLHRLPGPWGIPGHQEWAGTHCSPFSLSGGPPKALTSLCSRFC